MGSKTISILFGDNRTTLEIGEPISSGGMGEVHRGKILGPNGYEKPVAIKRIKKDYSKDKNFREKFFREARIGASLSHPNIAQTLAFGEDPDGTLYLVLELIEWPTLRYLIDRRVDDASSFDQALVARIINEIAETLSELHKDGASLDVDRGVVHGDLSPENILVDQKIRIKIIDFGISCLVHTKPDAQQPGKLDYMAPEVLRGAGPTPKSDIYSLGVLAFEMLCGHVPFDSRIGDKEQSPCWPEFVNVSSAFQALVNSMLEENPNHRPSSIEISKQISGHSGGYKIQSSNSQTVPDVRNLGIVRPRFLYRWVLVVLAFAIVVSGTLWFYLSRASQSEWPLVPRIQIFDNKKWINIGPNKNTERLNSFQLELGKRLSPAACQDACETALGVISILLYPKLPGTSYADHRVSPQRFIESTAILASKLQFRSDILNKTCGNSPSCSALLDASPWLSAVSEPFQTLSKNSKSISFVQIRELAKQLDAGGKEREKLEKAMQAISNDTPILKSAVKTSEAKIYAVSAIAGIDLIVANFSSVDALTICQNIGDEFFAKKIDPMNDLTPFKSRPREETFSAIILPEDHNLNVLNADGKEIVFKWLDSKSPSKSKIFSNGLCLYLRNGLGLHEVSHWIPEAAKSEN